MQDDVSDKFNWNIAKHTHPPPPPPPGPRIEKTHFHRLGFAIDTGADQPAYPRSLISAFVIRFLESIIISKLKRVVLLSA